MVLTLLRTLLVTFCLLATSQALVINQVTFFYSSVIAIKYTLYSMNLNYFSSLIQEAGQSKAYKEDKRNIYLLEGDIFIDFDVQFNDTNQVNALITTDQDRLGRNDYSGIFSEYI